VLCGLTLAGGILAGCSTGPKFAEIPGMPSSSAGAAMSPAPVTSEQGAVSAIGTPSATPTDVLHTDVIHIGDSLVFTFADLPMAAQPIIEDKVRDNGMIVLIQNLSFKADGKTRSQLEKEIREAYVPQYFKTMTVSVNTKGQTQFYYVDGDVKRPDRQVYIGRLKVTQAIASANGFTDFARKSDIQLTRMDGTLFHINFNKALKDPSKDLEVFPGDKIWVPRRNPIH